MPCVLCGREECGADEGEDYACGSCVVRIGGLDSDGRQHLVDQFYLKNEIRPAEFLEAVFFGKSRCRKKIQLKKRFL